MRLIKICTLLLIVMVQSIAGCGGGGGGGGGGGVVITSSISTNVSALPNVVSTISISGVSSPIICGVNLRLTYPNGTAYVSGNPSGVTPVGTILNPVSIGILDADVTIFGANGFSAGEIATINYGSVPFGSVPANFGVSVLKVFDCNGLQIQ